MRNHIILLTLLSCLSLATRGQITTDADLSEIIRPPVQVQSLRFWFNTDVDNIETVNTLSGVYTLNVSALDEGIHTLHYQVIGDDGKSYGLSSQVFLKVFKKDLELANSSTVAASKLQYWFDSNTDNTETVNRLSDVYSIDVADLEDGIHTLHYHVIGNDGNNYGLYSSMFIKMASITLKPIIGEVPIVDKLKYWFNQNDADAVLTDVENGIQTVDVSALPGGLNSFNYQVVYKDGNVSPVASSIFLKQFDAFGQGIPNVITKYQYWVNNHFIQAAELENATNPYQLVKLLPVQKMPIRSSSFHFGIENESPTIYAKNDIYVRFHDARGYFVDDSKQYIDFSVKQLVEPFGELQTTQTFPKVGNNEIRWYTVDVEPGDTLAFKSSQACTMQLFAPSGKELYVASGAESVAYGGIHVWESGTHYLAVHDVTGSKATMTLDYINYGKYAVLSLSPKEVGVMEGNFYIRLFGNGYDKLTKAQLIDNSNVLTADYIQIQDISNATLQFAFVNDEFPRGAFDLVLEFTDGDETERIIKKNAVTIAEPVFGDITVDVISHRTTAKPYPVTIKVKNTGNVTYQFVPLYLANSINQLESVHLLNFGLQSSKNVMDAGIKTFYEVEHLFGEDSCIVIPTVIPYVEPYQTLEYQIGFVTGPHAYFNMYAWTETPWNMRGVNIPETGRKGPRKASPTNITCEIDPCDLVSSIPNSGCVCNVLWGNISAIANIHGAVYQWRNNQLRNHYGQMYEEMGLEWPYKDIPLKTPGDILDQVIRGCLGELVPEELARVQTAIEQALDLMRNREEHQCPRPPRHPIDPYMPGDPNDIYGYLAESGTKFLADSVARVNYTIEFENDTALATASAHTIVIRDTLDSRYFDLKRFAPTSVKIGSRMEQLDGTPNFVKTIDMRPEIYAIAQVRGEYDEKKGIATWTFQSLDPMTMEPTDELMQGILPVNYDGTSGIGEVLYEIGVKPGKADGTEVNNRASIVFDYEAPILTPTWTNIVDAVPPTSCIVDGSFDSDSTIVLDIQGEDNRSGIWYYDVYAQQGKLAPWILVAEHVSGPQCTVTCFEDIEYGFCVLATDSAGNVERKTLTRELSLEEEDIETGLTETQVGNGSEATYDLSGRKTDAHRPGIYIRRGKKSLVRP